MGFAARLYQALWAITLAAFVFGGGKVYAHTVFLQSEAEAFNLSAATGRPVLLVFSGSDWCLPCIELDKKILSSPVFTGFADKHLVLLNADFPQRKKQEPALVKQNESLAERYNPNGVFPTVVLVGTDKKVITAITCQTGITPEKFVAVLAGNVHSKADRREFHKPAFVMGSAFELSIVDSADSERGWYLLEEAIAEIRRIEGLISEWNDTTQIGRLNAAAGKHPVKVDKEVYALIERSKKISSLTQGAFDVSFCGAGKLWRFDKQEHALADSASIAQALTRVGYQHILLLPGDSVMLEKPGMCIGFGAIGKGYAADVVKDWLVSKGITGGLINASGDLIAWGKRADGTPWKVGIADPQQRDNVLMWLPVENGAVATSGNYEKYFTSGGKRYAHIVDPRTAYPTTGISSVTIFAPRAELCDALATSVFVLGREAGIHLVEQLPGVNCIVIDNDNKAWYSKGLDIKPGGQ